MRAAPRRTRCAIAAAWLAVAAQAPGLWANDLLDAARRWLAGYDRALATVVATETCTEQVRRPGDAVATTRVLVSEFAWVPVLEGHDLIGVRGVRQVDGRAMDGAERLDALLRAPAGDREAQVGALLAESVRVLEVPEAVNFKFPTFALNYLRPDNAEGIRWSTGDADTAGTAVLHFRETRHTVVRTPEGRKIKAEGWLVVERRTGQVIETRLRLSDERSANGGGTESVRYEAHARFAEEHRLGFWVPVAMDDRYESTWRSKKGQAEVGLVIQGRSTYDNYRRFVTDARILPQ